MLGMTKVVFCILLSGRTEIGRTMGSGRRGYGSSSGRKKSLNFWLGETPMFETYFMRPENRYMHETTSSFILQELGRLNAWAKWAWALGLNLGRGLILFSTLP
ncbi:hypothetical protein TNCV_282231 [Trichonephila clavipes]|nr:hypothetical protein TNCV_282231 [Trichonephila clavipes]